MGSMGFEFNFVSFLYRLKIRAITLMDGGREGGRRDRNKETERTDDCGSKLI